MLAIPALSEYGTGILGWEKLTYGYIYTYVTQWVQDASDTAVLASSPNTSVFTPLLSASHPFEASTAIFLFCICFILRQFCVV